jgi:hypothetical protein
VFDMGNIHDDYINKLIQINQETDKCLDTLHQVYLDYFFCKSNHKELWSAEIRPTVPTSENLDASRQHKRFPLAVDWITEAQRGIKDKQAFVDYVSRLQGSQYWTPDPEAVVERVDDHYLGVWLNGMGETQARWFLKEGIPCYIVWELNSRERV